MNSWAITNLDLRPHAPEILASTDDARAVALMIPAGESFDDHQVHERAWVTVLDGEVEITSSAGESVVGGSGLLVEFAPNERHAVHARSDARLLLLLTPWPGVGHPGAMTLDQKANARHDAAEHRAETPASPLNEPSGEMTASSIAGPEPEVSRSALGASVAAALERYQPPPGRGETAGSSPVQ